jgi:hypothetical protein
MGNHCLGVYLGHPGSPGVTNTEACPPDWGCAWGCQPHPVKILLSGNPRKAMAHKGLSCQ